MYRNIIFSRQCWFDEGWNELDQRINIDLMIKNELSDS